MPYTINKDSLAIKVFESRSSMGLDAANMVSEKICELLKTKQFVNMIFAAAPSQNDFLDELIKKDIEWNRINAFHMDEYVGLDANAPQGFGTFLKDRLFKKVPFHSVQYINGNADDLKVECDRYANLLSLQPADIVCMGIGENTHLAFNDPHVADFNDQNIVKIVDLDMECRQQQVNDGCFNTMEEVPTHALTLTIPTLIKPTYVYCIVPGEKKAKAVYQTLNESITEKYPSTILRKHQNAILFIDEKSSVLI
ncbi:glucosamine-6-phosphate deaminase [Mucilaginibacter sp.]|uniref:glucosamine-6-phosphate deaminase n=1 Tax=Mucilaginibacter sp. TaxID=1882438 RepID=UPI0026207CDC|nr:glucosamine-6-phosphate deaminase [Mucilaginibacter sp.]MDB4926419.1 Glucosamine-6-phosphate deaminase [Mucilaginibacter sp.]